MVLNINYRIVITKIAKVILDATLIAGGIIGAGIVMHF